MDRDWFPSRLAQITLERDESVWGQSRCRAVLHNPASGIIYKNHQDVDAKMRIILAEIPHSLWG